MMWNQHACERESEVRRMVRLGAHDPALREHAAGCEVCRETLTVAAWMQELSALAEVDRRVPDPAYIWWKAELLRRWDAERRAAAPLDRGEPVQVGIGLLGTVALLVWIWPQIPGLASAASGAAAWVDTFALTALGSIALLVVIAFISIRDLIVETDRKERT
jgi:hypothetical protein